MAPRNDSESQYVKDQQKMYETQGVPPDGTARLALEDLQFQRDAKKRRIGDTYLKGGFDYYNDLMERLGASQSMWTYPVAAWAALGYAAADVSMGGPARALSNLLQDSSTPWERIKGGVLLPLELIASTGTGGPLGKKIAGETGKVAGELVELGGKLVHTADSISELLKQGTVGEAAAGEWWDDWSDVDLRGTQLDPEAVKYANQRLAEETGTDRQLTMSPGDYPARKIWMDHYLKVAGQAPYPEQTRSGPSAWGSSGP
jgi:hypothetical protein